MAPSDSPSSIQVPDPGSEAMSATKHHSRVAHRLDGHGESFARALGASCVFYAQERERKRPNERPTYYMYICVCW